MKVLVFGAGSIGTRHVNNLKKYVETGVYDPDENNLNKFKDDKLVNCFHHEDDAWQWKADGIVVSTPNNLHLGITRHEYQTFYNYNRGLSVDNSIDHPVHTTSYLGYV